MRCLAVVHHRGCPRCDPERTPRQRGVIRIVNSDEPCDHHGVPVAGTRPQRSRQNRVVAGVAAGTGAWLGVDPVLVRLAFVVLTAAGGAGVVLYAAGWVLLPEGDAPARPAVPARHEQAIAFACLALGALLLTRRLGLWFPGHVVWPLTLAAAGFGLVWARSDEAERQRDGDRSAWLDVHPLDALAGGGPLGVRLLLGALLLLAGIGSLLATGGLDVVARVFVAIAATAVGVGLLVGPWIVRLLRALGQERRERIRSEERSEMAAHLHDSVLQTLALIQRQAESPADTVRLARRQERELRAWLYGDRRRPASGTATLSAVLDALASEIEAHHAVTVDVVTVGDRLVDDRLAALVGAVREAAINAARHSGAPEVSVYVEVEDQGVSAYVRDRGKGFDPTSVPEDRRGIAESVVGRMRRHGGTAEIASAPGEGTEVAMHLGLHTRPL